MNPQHPIRISAAFIFPLIAGVWVLLGTQIVLTRIQAYEAVPPPHGHADLHLSPFPSRLLWDVALLAALGIASMAATAWAMLEERERLGKRLTLLVALALIPSLLIATVSFHEYVVGNCDAHHLCDQALGQWEEAPGFFHFIAADVFSWLTFSWFVNLGDQRMWRVPVVTE
jgi:hypothetical protein